MSCYEGPPWEVLPPSELCKRSEERRKRDRRVFLLDPRRPPTNVEYRVSERRKLTMQAALVRKGELERDIAQTEARIGFLKEGLRTARREHDAIVREIGRLAVKGES